jgi:hypothetical protein
VPSYLKLIFDIDKNFMNYISRMAPRRDSTTDAALTALIARQMATILPTLVTQLNQANATTNQRNKTPHRNFKHFNSCHPPMFLGNKGTTGLLQWFESIGNTFTISDYPNELRVRYTGSVLQRRALAWWNGEKHTRGTNATLSLSWEEFEKILTEKFCPHNEIKELEDEFYHLIQRSGDNPDYTIRFHELSILIPHMVTPLSRAVENYIGGLPLPIKDAVSIHLSISLPTYLSIHLSIYLSIYLSILYCLIRVPINVLYS